MRVTSSVYRITKKKKHKEERDMKKIMTFVAIAILAAFCLACSKEIDNPVTNQPQEKTAIECSTVYLNIGLSEDTKISHDLDGTTIKPRWESTDALKVTFTVSATPVEETFNIDASSISADGRSARFYKDDSQLVSRDENFDVAYAGNATDWSVQDGTYANLPEVLAKTGLSSTDSPIALESQLTYFHFDLSTAATPTEALELANAYFYNNTHALIIDSSNNTGDIKITRTMTYTTGGAGTNADFYVAAKLAADSNSDTFGIDLQNGDHYAGVQGYSLTWNAAKSYSTGAVYKITSVGSGEGKLLAYVSGMVGAENNTTGWWGAIKQVSVPIGKRMVMNFTNYTGASNWNSWHFAVEKNSPWYLIGDLSSDRRYRYGDSWDPYTMTDNYDVFLTKNGSFMRVPGVDGDWKDFLTEMNEADVTITLDHGEQGYAYVYATSISSDKSTEYVETFGADAPKDAVITGTLTTDGTHYIVKSITLSDIPTNESVNSISANTNAKVEGGADKIILSECGITVSAKMKDDITTKNIAGSSKEFTVANNIVDTSTPNTSTVYFRGTNLNSACNVSVSPTTVLADLPSFVKNTAGIGIADKEWTVNGGESQTIAMTVSLADSEHAAVYHCPVVEVWMDEHTCFDQRMDGGSWRWHDSSYADIANLGIEAECVRRYSDWENDADIINALKATPLVYVTVSNDGIGHASIRFYIAYTIDATPYERHYNVENIDVPAGSFRLKIGTEMATLTFK